MRVAAIDIGTNTVLLVVAERDARGTRPILERATITRLGEGVDRTRRLGDAARERTLRCLESYADLIRGSGVERVAAVGTSALRDAQGGAAFVLEIERLLGVRPRIIAGDEEAELTFRGALSGLDVQGEVIVFDIGGGSTEIVHGDAGDSSRVAAAVSLDIGSVRLFERHVTHDPPLPAEIDAARSDARGALRRLAGRPSPRATLVGVAGTITTLAAIELQLVAYDPARVHGSLLARDAIERQLSALSALPLAERTQTPGLEPGRADVIVVGAALALEVMLWAGADRLVVSDRGVRWGLVEKLLAGAHAPARRDG